MVDSKLLVVSDGDAADASTGVMDEHAAMATTTERMLRMNIMKGDEV